MPQSKQASLCITINMKHFTRLQHQSIYFKAELVSLPHKNARIQPSWLQQTKQTKTKNKNKDAPRTTHSIWSNKNIASWKMTWYFVDEEGDALGIPKLWRLYLLDISWGNMGIPKLELLSILYLITSFFSPYTWKLPSYKTSHNFH